MEMKQNLDLVVCFWGLRVEPKSDPCWQTDKLEVDGRIVSMGYQAPAVFKGV